MLYLLPYGSTTPNNIEFLMDDLREINKKLIKNYIPIKNQPRFIPVIDGPIFIFYDQEPLYGTFNYPLFDYIQNNYRGPFILVSTEKDSTPLDDIIQKYGWQHVYYFHHAFAAADWYRGYKFNKALLRPSIRKINKKFITFNRITGHNRVYRSIFIAELNKKKLLKYGNISYSDVCPVHGHYSENLSYAVNNFSINNNYILETKSNLDKINYPLRLDNPTLSSIPNGSQTIGPLNYLMESFLHVVTETCFWERKKHLTEKIFKPIVAKQPFVLLGCAHNLSYLKEYGFKTFDSWWDERYDLIEDPIQRINAVVEIIETISKMSNSQLEKILQDMELVLNYNFNWFYSDEFLNLAWNELFFNIKNSTQKFKNNEEKRIYMESYPDVYFPKHGI